MNSLNHFISKVTKDKIIFFQSIQDIKPTICKTLFSCSLPKVSRVSLTVAKVSHTKHDVFETDKVHKLRRVIGTTSFNQKKIKRKGNQKERKEERIPSF